MNLWKAQLQKQVGGEAKRLRRAMEVLEKAADYRVQKSRLAKGRYPWGLNLGRIPVSSSREREYLQEKLRFAQTGAKAWVIHNFY